jgi:hypothetical protein
MKTAVESLQLPTSEPVVMTPTLEESVVVEPETPVKVVEYLLETEKPISSTEYANLIQLVFNKTTDLLSAVHGQNNAFMADVSKLLATEGAIVAKQFVYPTLVYVLRQSVDASK